MAEWVERTYADESFDGREIPPELRQCVFVRCRFRGAQLGERRTTLCRFEECDFSYAVLNASEHRGTSFANSLFAYASFFSAELHDCQMVGANFTDADLRGVTIAGGDWSFAILALQDLVKQDLRRLKLAQANLSGCDLRKADLREADLTRAVLREARLAGADLRGANLEGVRLDELDLRGARLDAAQAILLARCHGAIVS